MNGKEDEVALSGVEDDSTESSRSFMKLKALAEPLLALSPSWSDCWCPLPLLAMNENADASTGVSTGSTGPAFMKEKAEEAEVAPGTAEIEALRFIPEKSESAARSNDHAQTYTHACSHICMCVHIYTHTYILHSYMYAPHT
jgi:hypothetical protein